jgi:hypothetical protein
VEFIAEKLRAPGYYSSAGGKLDYQVGDVMPAFFNNILGGAFSDVSSYLDQSWMPSIEQDDCPFFAMINMMDNHQLISTMSREPPIPISGIGFEPNPNLLFGKFGYSKPFPLSFEGLPSSPTVAVDLLEADIVGYTGDFDETSLSHENGSVPGYLPEVIGAKSVLVREYDLIRNLDFRLQQILSRLKDLDVYDDALIVVFGDHGIGTYKAKGLLQPQSLRTPLWIKYPSNEIPSSSKKDKSGESEFLKDDQMCGFVDLYPTTLSVLGQKPEACTFGRALAGEYRTKDKERDVIFALIARVGAGHGKTSFDAFTKDLFYQRHLLTRESVQEREGIEPAQVIQDAHSTARYDAFITYFQQLPCISFKEADAGQCQ